MAPSTTPPMQRIPWRVLGLAFLYTALLTVYIHLSAISQVGEDEVYLGFTQRDQITYYANAREILESGHWITYPNPYSHLENSPAHYRHLGITVSAWLWKMGMDFIVIDNIYRVVFGTLFFTLWWALCGEFFASRRLRLTATVIGWTGAGAAWIFALMQLGSHESFREAHHAVEHSYSWWFYCLPRNLMYATESLYHAFAFATLLLWLRGRLAWGCVALFFTWWAHPFTGLEIGFISALYLLVRSLSGRQRHEIIALAAVVVINALFLADALLMGRDPEHHSVVEQFEDLDCQFLASEILPAYGLWLIPMLIWVASRSGRRWMFRTRVGQLWMSWLVGVVLLVYNDRIPGNPSPLQPSHFTRGYLWLPLMIGGVHGIAYLFRRMHRVSPVPVLVVVCLLAMPDNVMFWTGYAEGMAKESMVTSVPRDDWDVIEMLQEEPGRTRVAVLQPALFYGMEYLIPTFTAHDIVVGHHINSAFSREKRWMIMDAWETGDVAPLRDIGVTILAIQRADRITSFAHLASEEMLVNSTWQVVRLTD